MMDPLIWATLLLLVGLALVVLEVFVPSGGLIGVLAGLSLIGSIVMAFWRGPATGLTFLALAVVGLPVCLSMAVNLWPDTPLGRRFLPRVPTPEEVMPDSEHRQALQALVGKLGRARSKMLPSGAAEFDGRTYDALSDGMAIEPGELVRVVEVRGNRVLVRPASEDEAAQPVAQERSEDDVLSRPIDSLGLDPFEDPIV